MTRREFKDAIAILATATGVEISTDVAIVWFGILSDLPASALNAAVARYIAEEEFRGLPVVAKLRRFAVEWMRGERTSADDAFAAVRAAVSRFGYTDPTGARDHLGPTIWQAVEGIGGWRRVCDTPVDQRATLFAQFRDAFRSIVDREERLARLPESCRPRVQTIEDHKRNRLASSPERPRLCDGAGNATRQSSRDCNATRAIVERAADSLGIN